MASGLEARDMYCEYEGHSNGCQTPNENKLFCMLARVSFKVCPLKVLHSNIPLRMILVFFLLIFLNSDIYSYVYVHIAKQLQARKIAIACRVQIPTENDTFTFT